MNRTKAILVIAGLLALVAVVAAKEGTVKPPTPTPTPTPTPPFLVSTGSVSLGAALSGKYLLHQGSGQLFLDISLTGDQALKSSKRLPINVGLVIDRSGSMAGQKLIHAKEAARKLINALREGDRLALFTYGSDVTMLSPSTVITSHTKATLLSAVESIVDRGGTFLSGGFERARDELLRVDRAGYVNRIILISDGQANEGVTSTSQLSSMARGALERGVHLTTMGVGLDFNENLMTAMAEHGGGHYYFIKDSVAMASIFAKELSTLVTTLARSATVTMVLEPGVELVELYGYTYERSGQTIAIRIPDLYAGQQRKIICKLKVPSGVVGQVPVALVKMAYTDTQSGKARVINTMARVMITRDNTAVERGKNKDVLAKAEEVTISKTLNQALESYSDGRVAAARSRLQAQIALTAKNNAFIRSKKLDRVLGNMKRQLKETEAAPSSVRGRTLIKSGKYNAYEMAH